jgi:hypothetical protein
MLYVFLYFFDAFATADGGKNATQQGIDRLKEASQRSLAQGQISTMQIAEDGKFETKLSAP